MAVADDFQDLSLTHTSLGMFHSESPQLWNKFSLTDEQVDQYWEHGYLTNVPVLSNEQCDMILEDYKHFLVSFSLLAMLPGTVSHAHVHRTLINFTQDMVSFTSSTETKVVTPTMSYCMH